MVKSTEEKPAVKVGQTVKVFYKIHEGSKTRVQPFEGLVIALKGSGVSRTFTVRHRGVDNVGVERIFPVESPNIEKIDVLSTAKVRRAKLYYVRQLSARSAKGIER